MTTTARPGRSYCRPCLSAAISFVALAFVLASPASAQTVDFSKAFLPPVIGPGSVSTLRSTISVGSGAGRGIEDVAFSDTLPAGIRIATPSASETTCVNGIVEAPDGGTTISLTGARVGAGVTCYVSVNVTSSTPGTHSNISGDLTSSAGNAGTASADLTVSTDRPGFSKSFAPSTVSFGGRSTLTLTIDNTANPNDATTLSFADDFPPGMTVADPPNASTTCENNLISATLDAAPGSSAIDFSFFGISSYPAPPLCQVVVDVIGGAVGNLGNTTEELMATVGSQVQSGGKASAALTVTPSPLAFTKSFKEDPVGPGGFVDLEFSITNLSREEIATGITLTDDLDAVLPGLASISGSLSDMCGPGSALSGAGVLTLSGGSLGPGVTCVFGATLQVPAGASPGVYQNTTSAISGVVGGTGVDGAGASDNLFVSAAPLLTKTFTDDPVSPGTSVTLQFTIENTDAVSVLTDIAFTDELTTIVPFPVSAVLPTDGFCGAGASLALVSLGTDSHALSMTGGDLAGGASCTFDVLIDIPDDVSSGTYVNTTEPITGMLAGEAVEGRPAGDALEVVAPPRIRKVFAPPVVARGSSVTLEFTLTHGEEAMSPATDIAFSDDLTAALPGLARTDTPLSDICAPGSVLTGSDVLSFTGGSLAPGEECVFSVTLAVPAAAPFGNHVNRTSNVTATVGEMATSGNRAEADLFVTPLTLTKEFTDDPVLPGGTVHLRFSITNLSATQNASGIFFSDNLDAAVSGLAAVGLPLADACGAGSQLSGTNALVLSGGNLGPGQSCTFDAEVVVPVATTPGMYTNVTSTVFATVGSESAAGPGASDVLTIEDSEPSLALRKEFTDDPVSPGSTVTLEFTISYVGPDDASGITFTDDLDATLSGLSAIGLPAAEVCGAGSQLAGTSALSLTGGTLASGTSCTFTVALQVPEGVSGSYTNTTSDATGRVGGVDPVTGGPATDDLAIEAGEGRNGSIGDFVWYDANGDGIQNETGSSGLAGVTVVVNSGVCPGTSLGTTTTTNEGGYLFVDLAPGDYCVEVDETTVTLPIPGAVPLLTTGNERLTVTLSTGERYDRADFGYDVFPVGTTPASDVPTEYALKANYPNPFNPTTTISYDLPRLSDAMLAVYDVLGRQISVLFAESKPAGAYQVSFDASGLPSGVYFYRLEAGDFVGTSRMVVMK